MIAIIFGLPVVQLFIFAYALTTDLKQVKLAVLDQDNSVASRELVRGFISSGWFREAARAGSPEELARLLEQGRADVTLWIPPDFSRRLAQLDGAAVAIGVDGSNSSIAGRAGGYAEAVVRRQALAELGRVLEAHPQWAERLHIIRAEDRFYYNPELESRFYMLPGIIVLILTVVSGMLSGMAVVREKEIGTLEQLLVTPLKPLQLIIGKALPFVALALLELALATGVAVFWFKLPLVGSVGLLTLCALVYFSVTLGIGLLASTVSQTQQQAMFTVWFFLVFGILMSGFFFPIENMPGWVQKLTLVNPMRYIMKIVRGIFLKGSTFGDVLPDLAPLAGLGLVIFTAAVVRFRKRVG